MSNYYEAPAGPPPPGYDTRVVQQPVQYVQQPVKYVRYVDYPPQPAPVIIERRRGGILSRALSILVDGEYRILPLNL